MADDWYQLRTVGIALDGPPVTQVAPAITQGEYVEAVRKTQGLCRPLIAPFGDAFDVLLSPTMAVEPPPSR